MPNAVPKAGGDHVQEVQRQLNVFLVAVCEQHVGAHQKDGVQSHCVAYRLAHVFFQQLGKHIGLVEVDSLFSDEFR